jgi:hypothetical protein
MASDLNFLIRTIILSSSDLILDKIIVPFEFEAETQIDNLAVSTKIVFSSYGLKAWRSNEQN